MISILKVRHHHWFLQGPIGKAELANERFTSAVKVGSTWGKQSLITNKGILSYPRASFEGIAIITFRTSSLVTALNSNSSSEVRDGQRLKGMERFDKPCNLASSAESWAAFFSHRYKKVIEFISKCICVFGEARATCLVWKSATNGFPNCPKLFLFSRISWL